jgi:hypothetical protein
MEGKIVRIVTRLVSPPEHVQREQETWSKAEVKKLLTKAFRDRRMPHGGCHCTGCAAVRSWACGGQASVGT